MSADASVAPLPQGPWTPVLLGPHTALPLSHRLRVARSLLMELSGSSCGRNQEGRRQWSLPSSRISPPSPPPLFLPPSSGQLLSSAPLLPGGLRAERLPRADRGLGVGAQFQRNQGLGSCWPKASGGKGFYSDECGLDPLVPKFIFLLTPASHFTSENRLQNLEPAKVIRLMGRGGCPF